MHVCMCVYTYTQTYTYTCSYSSTHIRIHNVYTHSSAQRYSKNLDKGGYLDWSPAHVVQLGKKTKLWLFTVDIGQTSPCIQYYNCIT